MRAFWIVGSTCVLVFIADVTGRGEHPPKRGSCDDGHGKLSWVSEVSQIGNAADWNYSSSVTNLHTDNKCRVAWTNGSRVWKSTVPPKTTFKSVDSNSDLPPEEVRGTIRYNGGREPGEATADAPAWFPKSTNRTAKSHVRNTAEFGFEHNDRFYYVKTTGESRFTEKDGMAQYSYYLKAEIDPQPRRGDFALRWRAIGFKELTAKYGDQFTAVPVSKDRRLGNSLVVLTDVLALDGKVREFRANVEVRGEPSWADSSIQLIAREGGVLAEAWMPAALPSHRLPDVTSKPESGK